jgi:hypothetical protein
MKFTKRPLILFSVFILLLTIAMTADRASSAGRYNGVLQGQIADHFGAMIPGVIVTAINADTGSVAGEAATDRGGVFLFTGLEPGKYTVKVAAFFPFGETEESVTVEANGVSGLKIVLGRGCSRTTDTGGLQERFLSETVRLAVKDSLDRLGVPHAKGQTVLMSRANIKSDWLTPIQDVDLKLIPEGIPPPPDPSGSPVKFLRISEIRTAGGCSSISIGYVSGEAGANDSGFTVEFRKTGEKWFKRAVLEVIS